MNNPTKRSWASGGTVESPERDGGKTQGLRTEVGSLSLQCRPPKRPREDGQPGDGCFGMDGVRGSSRCHKAVGTPLWGPQLVACSLGQGQEQNPPSCCLLILCSFCTHFVSSAGQKIVDGRGERQTPVLLRDVSLWFGKPQGFCVRFGPNLRSSGSQNWGDGEGKG